MFNRIKKILGVLLGLAVIGALLMGLLYSFQFQRDLPKVTHKKQVKRPIPSNLISPGPVSEEPELGSDENSENQKFVEKAQNKAKVELKSDVKNAGSQKIDIYDSMSLAEDPSQHSKKVSTRGRGVDLSITDEFFQELDSIEDPALEKN